MSQKDFVSIWLAIFLVLVVFFIGAKSDWLKNKLKIEQSEPANFFQSEQYLSATSSENILVSSPQPNEIIKGTAFTIKGRAKISDNALNIKIKDANSDELWSAVNAQVSAYDSDDFKPFEIKVDVKPHSGWATLEIFSASDQKNSATNLVSFPIKISPSL